jgi:hypothetical protein
MSDISFPGHTVPNSQKIIKINNSCIYTFPLTLLNSEIQCAWYTGTGCYTTHTHVCVCVCLGGGQTGTGSYTTNTHTSMGASEVELAIEKLKSHQSRGTDEIPAKLIKAGCRTTCSEIHKLIISIWKKEELSKVRKELIIVRTYLQRR